MSIEIRIAKQQDAASVHSYYSGLLDEKIPYIMDNQVPTIEEEESFLRWFIDFPINLNFFLPFEL